MNNARMMRWGLSLMAAWALSGCASSDTGSLHTGAQVSEPADSRMFYDTAAQSPEQTLPAPVKPEVELTLPITPAVQKSKLEPPASVVNVAPASRPAPEAENFPASGVSSGQYNYAGCVVATVYDHPIYADEVLSKIQKPLMAKAILLPPDQFRAEAFALIGNEISTEVHDWIFYAAADRELSDNEKKLAQMHTVKWRQDQINAAGGSVELARKSFAADGRDFDRAVDEFSRTIMIIIWRQAHILPKIQITANDMREYYEQHLNDPAKPLGYPLQTPATARFRLIRVGIAETGGQKLAEQKAQEIYQRAASGVDFAELAHSSNDDKGLAAASGLVLDGSVQRGSFIHEKVEKAVWETTPGSITKPILDGDAYYIAKVEALTPAGVRPFDDEKVQDDILTHLTNMRMQVDQNLVIEKSKQENMVVENQRGAEIILNMVMEKYAQWHGK